MQSIFERMVGTSIRENNEEKRKEEEEEMNWPDDDFIFQQQQNRVLSSSSFLRSVRIFFSRMYIRLNKYESKRTYEMILDEARRRQRLFFSSSSSYFKTKPQVKMWRRKQNQSKEFLYILYTKWPLKCNQCECHRCSFHCKL